MNLPSVKILYTSAYAQMVGGGQESLLQLLKRLDRSKFTPLVVCPGKGEFSTKVAALNAETRILPFPKLKHTKVWRPASTIVKLRRLILKEKIGIVHCDTLYTTVYAGLACLGTRVPAIFHARTAESGGFLDRIAFILSKNIICVSRAVAGRFATFSGYEKKTRVIYNGVDTDEFKSDSFRELAKKRYHIPPANKVIGYCGQLIEGKGVGTLVQAFKRVREELPDTILILAGRGEAEGLLKKMVKTSGMEFSVIFTGHQNNISEIIGILDIFVLPTFYKEGLSRSIIEAMAMAKPVITTPLGGNPEAVVEGVTGLLVPPGDVSALSKAITSFLKESARAKEMGKAGRKRVEELFRIEENVCKTENIYSCLCEGVIASEQSERSNLRLPRRKVRSSQ